MNEQIKKTAKAIRMNCDYPVLEGAPTRQCYICKCKEQPRALHVDLGAIWLCDNCKAKMEEQDIKQTEEMKIDVLESIAWKDLDDDVTALDIDSTTEHLRSKGYRKQEWISVEDRLPSSGDLKRSQFHSFLVANEFGEVREAVFTGKYFAKLGSRLSGVTHWMPLPEPPKMKGGAE